MPGEDGRNPREFRPSEEITADDLAVLADLPQLPGPGGVPARASACMNHGCARYRAGVSTPIDRSRDRQSSPVGARCAAKNRSAGSSTSCCSASASCRPAPYAHRAGARAVGDATDDERMLHRAGPAGPAADRAGLDQLVGNVVCLSPAFVRALAAPGAGRRPLLLLLVDRPVLALIRRRRRVAPSPLRRFSRWKLHRLVGKVSA